MVTRGLLKDPEWRSLSSSAKVLYIYLRSKFNNTTLNHVTLAYSEMSDLMSSKTMSRALKELSENFIEKHKQGGLFGGTSTYRFKGPHKDFYYKGHKI